jgi:lipoate-protein ligase A
MPIRSAIARPAATPAPPPPVEPDDADAVRRALHRVPWRILVSPPLSGAENMALDEALMERARRSGEAVLRIYGWRRPTLSLGRNQRAAGQYDLSRAAALGVDFVRRPTGGRAVLHHREVTYSITAPAASMGTLRESYRCFNRLVLGGLRRLGVPAEAARSRALAPRPGVAPCFETPVADEIVAGGRKLVGSAQFRERDALLQHGSILVEDDQCLAASLLIVPIPASPPPATLRALLGRTPGMDEVAAALIAALGAGDGHDAPGPLDHDARLETDARAARSRYEDPAWTWRR